MGAYRALSDSIAELNRMLIGRAEFDGQMELERAKIKSDNQRAMEAAKDRALNRELTMAKVQEIRDFQTPREQNLGELVGLETLASPQVHNNINKILDPDGSRGIKIDLSTGTPKNADGSPYPISNSEMEKLMPGIIGVIAAEYNTPEKMLQQKAQLTAGMIKVDNDLKGFDTKEKKMTPKYRETLQAKAVLQNQLKKNAEFFTPSGQMAYNGERLQQMNKAQIWARSKGMDEIAEYYSNRARQFADDKSKAMTASFSSKSKNKYQSQLIKWYNKAGDEVGEAWVIPGEDLKEHGFDRAAGHTLTRPHKPDAGRDKTMSAGDAMAKIDQEIDSTNPAGMKFTESQVVNYRENYKALATNYATRKENPMTWERALQAARRDLDKMESAFYDTRIEFRDGDQKQLMPAWSSEGDDKKRGAQSIEEFLIATKEQTGTTKQDKALIERVLASKDETMMRNLAVEFAAEIFNLTLKAATGGLGTEYLPNEVMVLIRRGG